MSFSNKRILIIDDQIEIHQDFYKILAAKSDNSAFEQEKAKLFAQLNNSRKEKVEIPSYKIESAYQGEEGLEMVKKACEIAEPYALAFVDIRMTVGWDGIETIQHIWKVDPEIQIVICTAHSDYTWANIADKLAISDNFLILKKPFDPIEIIQLASALTKKWELTRSLNFQIGTLENIVEARTADLAQAKEIAEQANKTKTEFLRNVSHELLTPLNIIISIAQLLSNEKINLTDKQELFDDVLPNAHSLLQMIHDILYISTIETQEFELSSKSERIEMIPLINEVKQMFKRSIIEKQLKFEISVDSKLSYVVNDLTQLKRVIFHLVSNAVKFTPEKERIQVRVFPESQEMFRLEVVDSGIGIQKEDISKLFLPFQQLDSGLGKKYHGLGIGLALVRHIVESLGGKVGVENKNGPGIVFFITLPVNVSE